MINKGMKLYANLLTLLSYFFTTFMIAIIIIVIHLHFKCFSFFKEMKDFKVKKMFANIMPQMLLVELNLQ